MKRWPLRRAFEAVIPLAAALLATTGRVAASPVIFWASDPVRPDDTVLVAGADLKSVARVEISRLRPGARDGAAEETADAAPLDSTDESLKFALPPSLGAGVYRYRLVAPNGSAVGYLNEPSLYWVQGDDGQSATQGGWIRLMGRNMARSPAAALTLLSPDGATRFVIGATDPSLWSASFKLPANVPPGRWTLKLWNGEGDPARPLEAGSLDVNSPKPPDSALVNVRQSGATGDGVHDDTAAVRAAIADLAAHGGGTVFFPRGRYLLSGELDLPAHVSLKGEGRDLASLDWIEFPSPPPALISGVSDFAVEDLTIYATTYEAVINGGFPAGPGLAPGRNISVKRVRIRASAYYGHLDAAETSRRELASQKPPEHTVDTVRLSGVNLKIVDCDLYGSGRSLYLSRPTDAYVAGNEIYNGRWGGYTITGADGVVFENNRVTGADLQSTGGGINTLGYDVASSRNVLFMHNSFMLMHGWDREAVTSDGPEGYYYGRLAAQGASQVELLDHPSALFQSHGVPWQGAGLFIVSGRGTGEFAHVASQEGAIVTLDRPLTVLPDATSLASIVQMQENYLIIDNEFSDAGVAVQFYGTSLNNVVAGNRSTRTAGFFDWGLLYQHFQPSWYNQFLHNTILEGNVYRSGPNNALFAGEAAIDAFGGTEPNMPPITRGIIIRGNDLQNNAYISVRSAPGGASIRDVIVEDNHVAHADAGITVDKGIKDIVVRKNVFLDVGKHVDADPTDQH